jgi:hypothetical protein
MEKLYQNEEYLNEQYINLRKSTYKIAKECGCSRSPIRKRLIKFGIPIRSISEAMKQKYENGFSTFKGKDNMEKLLKNRDWLYNQYVELGKSIPKIAKECECSTSTIGRKLIKFRIPIRSKSEAEKQKYETGYINPNWKGDEVGYGALHVWVRENKQKPEKCELCGEIRDKNGVSKLELSFIDHNKEYTRDINDYQWAHHSCHMNYDKEHIIFKKKKLK